MDVLALQAAAGSGGQIEQIARTFGVSWPHFLAQIVSFGIVCLVLYVFAFTPVLRMLEARRQQIASGLANAEAIRAELAGIDAKRREVLMKADAAGQQLIEEARNTAARLRQQEIQKANAAANQILARAHDDAASDHTRMLAQLKREVGRLVVQTTAAITGKILTTEDQQRLSEETARHLTTR